MTTHTKNSSLGVTSRDKPKKSFLESWAVSEFVLRIILGPLHLDRSSREFRDTRLELDVGVHG